MQEDFVDEMTFELDPNGYMGMHGGQFQAEGTARAKAQKSESMSL